jgi:hypothetical protein
LFFYSSHYRAIAYAITHLYPQNLSNSLPLKITGKPSMSNQRLQAIVT